MKNLCLRLDLQVSGTVAPLPPQPPLDLQETGTIARLSAPLSRLWHLVHVLCKPVTKHRLSVETIWWQVSQEDLTSGIYGFLLAYMKSEFALLHVFRATFKDISILTEDLKSFCYNVQISDRRYLSPVYSAEVSCEFRMMHNLSYTEVLSV